MDKKSEEQRKKSVEEKSKLLKYFSLGLNMVYILCTPVILMALLYLFVIERFWGRRPVVFVILLVLGLVSGYYSFFKSLKKLDKH